MTRPSLPTRAALRRAVVERARIDTRALAALRVSLGLLLLLDLVLRSRHLVAFYTDDGIVTRSVLTEVYPLHPSLSLHALSGDVWFQVLLFLLAGVAAAALTVGYRTRLATVVSLVLLVSLHARNPTVLNSGDVLLRRLLFWGILLPLGARWSLDARGAGETPESVANIASLALLTQVVLVYAANAMFKLDSEVWLDGEAVGYVLELDRYSVFFGPALADLEPLLVALSRIWIALLLCSWLLLATTGWVRGLIAGLFVAMHAGMALTVDLGIFPLVSVASLLPFLPLSVWDRFDDVDPPALSEWSASARSGTGRAGSAAVVWNRVRRARPAIHGTLLALLLVSNAVALGFLAAPGGTPEELTDSSWTMFAHPPTSETWILPEGHLADDRTVDALRGSQPPADRPPDVDQYPNARWRKHMNHYYGAPSLRPSLTGYLCREWNDGGDRTLERIELRRLQAPIEPDPRGTRSNTVLGAYRCRDGRAVPVDPHDRMTNVE